MSRTLKSEGYCLSSISMPLDQPLGWQLDKSRCVLLIHDMQNYFVQTLSGELLYAVVNSTIKVLQWARKNNIPVFFSAQPGCMTKKQRGLLNDLWGPGMCSTEEDRQIITELVPRYDETVLTKWRYSAFYNSPLADMLNDLKRDSLIITGIYASVGISATAIDAFTRDIKPFLVSDAIADFTQFGHQQAVDYLADNCARVTSVDEVTTHA
ncbi:isochorismatase family protein [Serratia proteamaculans]